MKYVLGYIKSKVQNLCENVTCLRYIVFGSGGSAYEYESSSVIGLDALYVLKDGETHPPNDPNETTLYRLTISNEY